MTIVIRNQVEGGNNEVSGVLGETGEKKGVMEEVDKFGGREGAKQMLAEGEVFAGAEEALR